MRSEIASKHRFARTGWPKNAREFPCPKIVMNEPQLLRLCFDVSIKRESQLRGLALPNLTFFKWDCIHATRLSDPSRRRIS